MGVIDVETTTEKEVLDLREIIMVETVHVHTELGSECICTKFYGGMGFSVFFLSVDLFPVS